MILIFLCVVETAFAGKWRLRAREHFDTVTLKYGNHIEKETTSGIGPTIIFGGKRLVITHLDWLLV